MARRFPLFTLIFLAGTCLVGAEGGSSPPSSKAGSSGAGEQRLWCVARNNAEDAALQAALDWVCGPGEADCGPIQQGGACFEPQDVQSHASYAFNDYFQKHGLDPQACVFSGTAAVTMLNPSQGNCAFPSSATVQSGIQNGTGPIGEDTTSANTGHGSSLLLASLLLAFILQWLL